MLTKLIRISQEIALRYIYFCFLLIKVFFSFKKAEKRYIKKQKIEQILSQNFSGYKLIETQKVISTPWFNILKKHKTNTLKNIENNNIIELQNTYENFISSELCIGVEDKVNFKLGIQNAKSSLRFTRGFFNYITSTSVYPIFNLYQPNKNFLNKINHLENKLNKLLYNKIKDLNVDKYNTYKLKDIRLPSDYFDHLYFFEFIDGLIGNKSSKFVEIGGGSGLLSELMQISGYIKSIHIDIAPYLLAQNLFLNSENSFLLSERISKFKYIEADFIINQDSFPEIPEIELIKILTFLKNSKIKRIFSNNHNSDNQSQSDFRSILRTLNYINKIRFPNPIREGYLIEMYEIKNN